LRHFSFSFRSPLLVHQARARYTHHREQANGHLWLHKETRKTTHLIKGKLHGLAATYWGVRARTVERKHASRPPEQAAKALIAEMASTWGGKQELTPPSKALRRDEKARLEQQVAHLTELREVAAVVAGKKPAAIGIDGNGFQLSAIGHALLKEAKRQGLRVKASVEAPPFTTMDGQVDPTFAFRDLQIGKSSTLKRIQKAQRQLKQAKSPKETKAAHRTIGEALGYPKKEIDKFVGD
jgi:hypothetical protein